MTITGWLQIALLFGLVLLTARPLGIFIANVLDGKTAALDRVFGPVERAFLSPARPHGVARAGLARLRRGGPVLQSRGFRAALCHPAPAGLPADQSGGPIGGIAGPRLQHGDLLRHQHQLAVLRRRDDHVAFDADGRPDGAEFRIGGGGHCRVCRPLRAASPARAAARSATSGSM